MARLILEDGVWKVVDDVAEGVAEAHSDKDNFQLDGETATDLGSGMARRADVLPNVDHYGGVLLAITGSNALAAGIFHLTSSWVDTTGTT